MNREQTIYSTKKPQSPVRKRRCRLLERADPATLPRLRLTQRDINMINACYEYRALSTDQLRQLFYQKRNSSRGQIVYCQHRLRLLFHHGYLHRDEQATKLSDGRCPLIYFLDEQGTDLLTIYLGVSANDLDWKPKDNVSGAGHLFLRHLLKTNDIRIALTLAARETNTKILHWLDDKTLKSKQMKAYVTVKNSVGKEQKVALVPDGYFVLQQADGPQQHHFIEADLRTLVGQSSKSGRRDWARKIRVYLAFYAKGLFKKRYQARSFRVLTVTTGQTRLDNLKRITEEEGGRNRFWFTTFDEVATSCALTDPIWQIANREGKHALLE